MLHYYFLNLDTIYCITKKIYTYSQCLLLLLLSINKKILSLKENFFGKRRLRKKAYKKSGKKRDRRILFFYGFRYFFLKGRIYLSDLVL